MLGIDDLRQVFAEFTYRPGWTFTVVEDRFEGLHLHIDYTMENSYRPEEPFTANVISPLPPMRDVEAVKDWLLWRLCRIEVHEACEWLRFDGELIRDPHREPVKT